MKLLTSPIIWIVLILSAVVFAFLYFSSDHGLGASTAPSRQISQLSEDSPAPVSQSIDGDLASINSDLSELSLESSDFEQAYNAIDSDNENVNQE